MKLVITRYRDQTASDVQGCYLADDQGERFICSLREVAGVWYAKKGRQEASAPTRDAAILAVLDCRLRRLEDQAMSVRRDRQDASDLLEK